MKKTNFLHHNTKPQQWKKEDSERLRGAEDQIKLTDLRFEGGQVVEFRKGRRRQVTCYGLSSKLH